MAQIFKHKNENGTFTYTDEKGNVIKKASKKDYEYCAKAPMACGYVFGTYKTCENGLKSRIDIMKYNLEYCKQVIAYKKGGAKPRDYMKSCENRPIEAYEEQVASIEAKIANAKIIKIESI